MSLTEWYKKQRNFGCTKHWTQHTCIFNLKFIFMRLPRLCSINQAKWMWIVDVCSPPHWTAQLIELSVRYVCMASYLMAILEPQSLTYTYMFMFMFTLKYLIRFIYIFIHWTEDWKRMKNHSSMIRFGVAFGCFCVICCAGSFAIVSLHYCLVSIMPLSKRFHL